MTNYTMKGLEDIKTQIATSMDEARDIRARLETYIRTAPAYRPLRESPYGHFTDQYVAQEGSRLFLKFKADMPFRDKLEWLKEGLDVLNDDSLAVGTPMRGRSSITTVEALRAAVQANYDEDTQEREEGDEPFWREADLKVSMAWLAQDDFDLWLKVYRLRENATTIVQDDLLSYVKDDARDLGKIVEDLWSGIVFSWYETQKDGAKP